MKPGKGIHRQALAKPVLADEKKNKNKCKMKNCAKDQHYFKL